MCVCAFVRALLLCYTGCPGCNHSDPCFLCCSCQYQDAAGNWVPAAVKYLPYSEDCLKKAVKDSDHNATLLHEGTVKRDNVCYRCIVMR